MFHVQVQGKEYDFNFMHFSSCPHLWGTGVTSLVVSHKDTFASQDTYCSHKDEYDEEQGEKEALTKFMRMMPWGKEERRKVWRRYFHWKWEQCERKFGMVSRTLNAEEEARMLASFAEVVRW